MITTQDLPHVNVTLNATTFVVLLVGYWFIRRRQEGRHKACMLLAGGLTVLFLTSYLTYHYQVGSVKYQGEGALRVVYFTILITHTFLAAINLPLVVMTIWSALSGKRQRHRRLARINLPIWLIVSVTGVVVYLMLYQL